MRLQLSIALVVGFVLAADAPGDKDEALKKDKQGLQGTWMPTSALQNGRPYIARLRSERLIIAGDKLTVQRQGKDEKAGFKIDPAQKPKAIDIAPPDGEEGEPNPAIYILDGDELKICVSLSGKDRPKEFEAGRGSNQMLLIFKREKPEK